MQPEAFHLPHDDVRRVRGPWILQEVSDLGSTLLGVEGLVQADPSATAPWAVRTAPVSQPRRSATSSSAGSHPSSAESSPEARETFRIFSVMCMGTRIVVLLRLVTMIGVMASASADKRPATGSERAAHQMVEQCYREYTGYRRGEHQGQRVDTQEPGTCSQDAQP
jgi:hypothetical protein